MKLKDRKKSNPYGKRGALFTRPDPDKKESAAKKPVRRKKKAEDNG